MLQRNTILFLHRVLRDRITKLNNAILDCKKYINYYDLACDINDDSFGSRKSFIQLNHNKNILRKNKEKLFKTIQLNKKLKQLSKSSDLNFDANFLTISELESLHSIIKQHLSEEFYYDYYSLSSLKSEMAYHYKEAIPGTKRGLLNFLQYNVTHSIYKKELQRIRRFESAVKDLKSSISFNYKLQNISLNKKELSFQKKLQKKFGYVKHNLSVVFN